MAVFIIGPIWVCPGVTTSIHVLQLFIGTSSEPKLSVSVLYTLIKRLVKRRPATDPPCPRWLNCFPSLGVIKEEARDHPANRAGRTRDGPSQPAQNFRCPPPPHTYEAD